MTSYILLENGSDKLLTENSDFLVQEDHPGSSSLSTVASVAVIVFTSLSGSNFLSFQETTANLAQLVLYPTTGNSILSTTNNVAQIALLVFSPRSGSVQPPEIGNSSGIFNGVINNFRLGIPMSFSLGSFGGHL